MQDPNQSELEDRPGSRFAVFYLREGEEHRTPWFTRRSYARRALDAMKRRGHQAVILED